MCIRDRFIFSAKYEEIADFITQEALRGVTVFDGIGWYTNCLLYTSDAADERSSVDLGGRRIIKKKKCNRLRRCMCNKR